ncbi:MAG: hypothetical protein A2V62_01410 [Nitrospirae bacterium RBG_19FT_COMBO_58_9]|nr:MAG: hypothetical protein A2V62_01410 [Nitrospirae bacterium RBG_19FT_COMBO_58_9]
MSLAGAIRRASGALLLGALVGFWTAPAQAESCALAPYHVGLTFPVSKVESRWACPLQAIIDGYTTANKVGPIAIPLPEQVYLYLLDHPPLAAALINRLDLGLHKSQERGPRRFWGDDGEGTSGILELVYQDRTNRIYYVEGTHESILLPQVTGKAVVFVRMNPVKDGQGNDAVDTTLVAYTKLDSRILAGLVSLIRPLVGSIVARKLTQGTHVVTRLGQEMRQHPDRVLFEATDPPALPDDEVAFLQHALNVWPHSGGAAQPRTPAP